MNCSANDSKSSLKVVSMTHFASLKETVCPFLKFPYSFLKSKWHVKCFGQNVTPLHFTFYSSPHSSQLCSVGCASSKVGVEAYFLFFLVLFLFPQTTAEGTLGWQNNYALIWAVMSQKSTEMWLYYKIYPHKHKKKKKFPQKYFLQHLLKYWVIVHALNFWPSPLVVEAVKCWGINPL